MRQVHVQRLGCAESDLHRQLHCCFFFLLKKGGVEGISPFFSCPSSSLLDGVVLTHGWSSPTLFLGCMSVVSRQTFRDVPRKESLNSSRHVSTQLSCSSRSIIAGYLGEEPLWLCGYDLKNNCSQTGLLWRVTEECSENTNVQLHGRDLGMAVAGMLASFHGNLTLARVISTEGLLIEKHAIIESACKQVGRKFP